MSRVPQPCWPSTLSLCFPGWPKALHSTPTPVFSSPHPFFFSGLFSAQVLGLDNAGKTTIIKKMSDEDIINYLTQIKGVGRWTVEMLLMFALQRENVFAVDDLGIQTAMCKLYGILSDNKKLMKAAMLQTAMQWEPYRSYACLYLWRFKDTTSPKTAL